MSNCEIKIGDVFNWKMSRRQFLGVGAATLGELALSSIPLAPRLGNAASTVNVNLPPTKFDREVFTLCEQCVWRCGLRAKVKDGKVYKLDGNPYHPHSNGMLCPRGQAGVAMLYDPDRISFPMIRAGDRGSGLWKRITWDEALNYTAQKMQWLKQQFGAESMVFSSTHNLAQTQFENLLHAYGSPNYGTQRSLCFNAMIMANLMTFGLQEPERDYSGAKYIIYTGRNLLDAISNSETQDLVAAIARGTKVVVLDPRFTKTASKATEWLPIRPGTDLAFFLAVLCVILTEELYDKKFVAQYTIGLDELAQAVKPYTPEWAASKTEIPATTIQRIAQEFAQAAPHAFAHPNWRTSNFVNSFQAERAISILNALIGNWAQPGGLQPVEDITSLVGSPPQPPYPRASAMRLDGVPSKYPLVPLDIGVFQEIRDAILAEKPYPARGWFVYRQNPVASLPERRKTLQAFSKLDFIVTVDSLMNDTAYFSDVVLPEANYLERYDPLAVVGNAVYIRQPAVEPLGESKSALWIFEALGTRLGLQDYFQYKDDEDYIRQQIEPFGITLDELKSKGYHRVSAESANAFKWDTPSGKIELMSSSLAKANVPSVPIWQEPPAPAADQFYLLTGKVAQHSQFATQNNSLLHERFPKNSVWIHPASAAARNIQDGDDVLVESAVGKVRIRAKVTEGIRPDCVYMPPGFGHLSKGTRKAYAVGASDSDLHLTVTDPVSGGQALSQTFVTVRKA